MAQERARQGYVGVDHEAWPDWQGGAIAADVLARTPVRAPIFSSPKGHKCASHRFHTHVSEYIDKIEAQTSGARRAMAAKLRYGAGKAPARGEAQATRSKWHEDRIRGLAERRARVGECGAPLGVFEGQLATGERVSRAVERRCGDHVLCGRCRERRRARMRAAVESQVPAARAARRLQTSRYYKGPEGRWSERLLTVTTPHSGCPVGDAKAISRAWRRFTRLLETHLKKDRGCREKPVWMRAVEVAEGSGVHGLHVHMHVWMLGPYIEHTLIRHYWGQALVESGVRSASLPSVDVDTARRKAGDARVRAWLVTRRGSAGRELTRVYWPHVDVRAAPREVGARYAAKLGVALYSSKGSDLGNVHPVHAAAAWHALRCVRVVAWARGWAPKREREWRWHVIRAHTADELASIIEKNDSPQRATPR